jgi:hypothetical protein
MDAPTVAALATACITAALTAALAHEATHWATARLLGYPAAVDWWGLECRFEVPDSDPQWRVRLISMAPQCVGGVVLAVVVIAGWLPTGLPGAVAALAWSVYTLAGSPSDFAPALARVGSDDRRPGSHLREQPLWCVFGPTDREPARLQAVAWWAIASIVLIAAHAIPYKHLGPLWWGIVRQTTEGLWLGLTVGLWWAGRETETPSHQPADD